RELRLGKPVPQIPSEASENCRAARGAKADPAPQFRLGKPIAGKNRPNPLPTRISKTTPRKVKMASPARMSVTPGHLTRWANQRHNSIIAQAHGVPLIGLTATAKIPKIEVAPTRHSDDRWACHTARLPNA
ncbi:hypothetical protein Q2941_48415, partial [Bradyrhizobium sp. UFLA05-153]